MSLGDIIGILFHGAVAVSLIGSVLGLVWIVFVPRRDGSHHLDVFDLGR